MKKIKSTYTYYIVIESYSAGRLCDVIQLDYKVLTLDQIKEIRKKVICSNLIKNPDSCFTNNQGIVTNICLLDEKHEEINDESISKFTIAIGDI